ncbi:uncharacterized protein LOC142612401 [Castanea sativa]|uniref:uncharacterized protein LOC142612401 n=1 Tax=Castanea sativa TaxID=21020 RepID=UPI003F64EEA5
MSRAFNQISKSPFTRRIEGGKLPQQFTQPVFTMYNGRTDPVEHVSHFNQRIVVHSKNETFMCKVFPFSLGPVAIRWFDGLQEDGGDPMRRNQSLHCQYHQERGHTNEDCRTLWSHLEQLVKIEKLKQFLYQPNGQCSQAGSEAQRDASTRPPLGTISAILTAPRRTGFEPSRVISIAQPSTEDSPPNSKRGRLEARLALNSSDEDKVGTL